jgi:hypothetical protein
MNTLIQLKKAVLVFLVALACFALSPTLRAVNPPPDGGYPGFNTAEGDDALFNLTIGTSNTAIGFNALFRNTIGSFNTATGFQALSNNLGGVDNTATGDRALFSNTRGIDNTANGSGALRSNITGRQNTATGAAALQSNTSAINNTANGAFALSSNIIGNNNTANGFEALFSNQTGGGNTADGVRALFNNISGVRNIALGIDAGSNLTTGSNNIDIGNAGVVGDAATIRIGAQGTHTRTFVAGIRGVTVAGGVGVIIGSNGQLGTMSSSERFKKEIEPMDSASEAILALKPVTFHYKSDATGTPQFGLVAEEVAQVNPDLVVRDENGEIYTVRYDAVNAMLLNEFLKEHSTVQELKKEIAALAATVKEQASQIQRVRAQLETNKPAASGQQSLEPPPPPQQKQRHFTISRHVSPRGDFLFHALRLFEIARVLVRCNHAASFIVNADHKLSEKPKSHLAATAVGCDGPRGVDSVCSVFNGAMNRGDGLLGPASRQSIELFY